jgi:glycosyltransferase involved in cell wall biosynthesis
MNPHILHVSNAFAQSALYKQLVSHLDTLEIHQTVYSAVRTNKEADYNPPELSHLNLHIRNLLHPYDRLFFRNKIRKISKDIFNEVDLSSVDLIHAHTLYSDGAVALKIKQNFNIPYIITVQNTALNAFGKYRPDLKWQRDKILKEAKKIVFFSPAYRQKLLISVSSEIKEQVKVKFIIIPNGINPYFLQSNLYRREDRQELKLLFVGRFIKLKNIPNLIKAFEKLPKELKASLTLVGSGEEEKTIRKMADPKPDINYLGHVSDKKKLCRIYQNHDIFVMVSKPETFGLVYLEALSQGLPIIYTKGEGVDGYFKEGAIAEAVDNPHDTKEIANKIEILSKRLDKTLQKECVKQAKKFDWNRIAKRYKKLYRAALENINEK